MNGLVEENKAKRRNVKESDFLRRMFKKRRSARACLKAHSLVFHRSAPTLVRKGEYDRSYNLDAIELVYKGNVF